MRAMVLDRQPGNLVLRDLPKPAPRSGEVLIRVTACAVCRTDLHIVDGELHEPKLPLVPGHQIVGTIEELGSGVARLRRGDRVGVPWLGWTCGECEYCMGGRENLCDRARFTGYHIDGGFAEFTVADERFAFRIPDGYSDLEAAPLLCGGLIGYRALRMAGDGRCIGFYGFGSAAHMLAQILRHENRSLYAFTRGGDVQAQSFARSFGATWTGGSNEPPPELLDAAIIFAPAGELVPAALRAVKKGGTVVCAGIHMSDIPPFPYEILWGERVVRSVANLTRRDGEELLALAPSIPIRTEIHEFALEQVNEALDALREGKFSGTAVVRIAN